GGAGRRASGEEWRGRGRRHRAHGDGRGPPDAPRGVVVGNAGPDIARGSPAHLTPRHRQTPARARTGHPSTSPSPPAALARNAGPAPYRWNTAPSATPPTSAAKPVTP